MAPMPVVALHAAVLRVVLTIGPVLCHEVAPVGAVFAVIPIMVVAIVPVIDSDLDTVLWRGVRHHDGRYGESSYK